MKTVVEILATVALLTIVIVVLNKAVARHDVKRAEKNFETYSVRCLDGIEYWTKSEDSSAALSIKIDSTTLKPHTC